MSHQHLLSIRDEKIVDFDQMIHAIDPSCHSIIRESLPR
jgi:hypothetical protein